MGPGINRDEPIDIEKELGPLAFIVQKGRWVMGEEKETRELLCVMTDEERSIRGQQLAEKMVEQDVLELRLDGIKQQYKSRINLIKSECQDLKQSVVSGNERRDVECEWDFNYPNGIKLLRRNDTHEILEEVELTKEEMNQKLPLEEVEPTEPVE